jgi:Cytochrome P460
LPYHQARLAAIACGSWVPPKASAEVVAKDNVATGGWGFGHFQDGKPSTDEAMMKTCFACHQQIQARDFVFTRYVP